jgi:hypothetical protein
MDHALERSSPLRHAAPAQPRPTLRIDRQRLGQELAAQRAHCAGRSAFYVAVLGELVDDLAESPPWAAALEHAWRDRRFAVGWEAAHLLLACLHHAALSGEAPELAAVYPSCGGNGVPGGAPSAYLRRASPGFWERVERNFVQTNEVDRSVAWLLVAAAAFGARRMPFHLVEMGSSAGLNLVGDHLPHPCRFVAAEGAQALAPAGWDARPHDIVSRAGLDIRPRHLADSADRLWLKACVWADDRARLERLDSAVETFLRLAPQADGPRLETRTFAQSPSWLLDNRPARPGEGLLVFNSIGTIYLADRDYAELREGMAQALAPWKGRGLWVEYERARGATDGPLELSVHRPVDGELHSRVLASGPPRPGQMELRGGWDFLARS